MSKRNRKRQIRIRIREMKNRKRKGAMKKSNEGKKQNKKEEVNIIRGTSVG
jgi:hypothetical protein